MRTPQRISCRSGAKACTSNPSPVRQLVPLFSSRSAIRKSWGRVSLMLQLLPLDRGRPQARPQRRSTYRPCSGPPRAVRCAARISANRKPCGVGHARGCSARLRRSRCMPSTRFSVSTTGTTGRTARCVSNARTTRSITAADTSGRAASWIRTLAGDNSTKLSRPLRTVACRVAAPIAGVQDFQPGHGTA